MRIDGRSTPTVTGPTARAAGGRPAAFSLSAEAGREATGARAAAPLATLDAILALQVEEDPRERRRRHARRGQDLLDDLDRLKAGLLSGQITVADLRALAGRLSTGGGPSGDPLLDETLAAIELRARVELAKLEPR